MFRVCVALLMLLMSAVMASPAGAAEAVALSASRSTVELGESVVLRGTARGEPGTRVVLQREEVDGWTTVAAGTTRSDRTYRFRTTPPRGVQTYRTVRPRQDGRPRAVSTGVDVVVRWRPALLDFRADPGTLDDYGDMVGSASVRAEDLPEGSGVVAEERAPDGTWRPALGGALLGTHPTITYDRLSHASTYRFSVAAAGPMRRAISPTFTTPAAAPLALNRTHEVTVEKWRPKVFGVDLVAGRDYAFAIAPNSWVVPRLLEPDGASLDVLDGDVDRSGAWRFQVPHTGTYRLELTTDDWSRTTQITWSTTRVLTNRLDAEATNVVGLPGQAVEVLLDGRAGQFVSATHWPDVLSAADGTSLGRFDQNLRQPAWRLPAEGRYRLRYLPDASSGRVRLSGFRLLSAIEHEVGLDDETPGPVTFDHPARLAVVRTTLTDPTDLVLSHEDRPGVRRLLVAPDGTLTHLYSDSAHLVRGAAQGDHLLVVSSEQPLTTRFWSSTPVEVATTLDAAPVTFDLGSIPDRHGVLRFPIQEDELYSLETRNPDGSLCDAWQQGATDVAVLSNLTGMPNPVEGWADGTGEVYFKACEEGGTLRFRPMVTADLAPTGPQPGQSVAPVRFTEPGQVAMITRDYNEILPARYRITGQDVVTTGFPDWRLSMDWDTYDFSELDLSPRIGNWSEAYLWTGEDGAGSMDLTFDYQSVW